jgi:hypothetical protein
LVFLELILVILYKQLELEKPDALEITNKVACKRFIERLKNFKYMDWKNIDPTCLEYVRLSSLSFCKFLHIGCLNYMVLIILLMKQVMTPALVGNPGYHYVCFVVDLKSQKFHFLNSLKGETLHMKNGEATAYKKMFDVWLKEVEAFVTKLYKKRKITMPFKFSTFKWETPKMPDQCDKNSCGVFCMKFLAEWKGGNTKIDFFKDWSKTRKHGKNGKAAKTMDLRIGICSSILSDSSNSKRNYVEKEATSYYEELVQKLER